MNEENITFTFVAQGGGGGGGGGDSGVTIISAPITTNVTEKTFCGDNICQSEGNDFGVQESFYSCQVDCKGVDLDKAVSGFFDSFIKFCFDNKPETICLTPILNILLSGKNNIQSDGEPTLINIPIGVIFLIFAGLLSFIKIKGPNNKKINPYQYLFIKSKNFRRKRR